MEICSAQKMLESPPVSLISLKNNLENMQLTVQAKGQQMPRAWLGWGTVCGPVNGAVTRALPTWGHVPTATLPARACATLALWAEQQKGALRGLLWLQSCAGGFGTLQPGRSKPSLAEPAQIPAWQ